MKQLSTILVLMASTLLYHCNNAQTENGKTTLSVEAFANQIEQTPDAIILDVRTPEEFKGGYISAARNIDYNSTRFQAGLDSLDKNKTYLVYCLSGGRSSSAVAYMRSNGFIHVYNLKGGVMAWENKNLSLTRSSSHKDPVDKISMEEYRKIISNDSVLLIDFYAPWCAPCKKMEPMLEEFAQENKGMVKVVRLNIDENRHLAKQLGVEEIPVLKFFKDGKEQWTHSGFVEKPTLVSAMSNL